MPPLLPAGFDSAAVLQLERIWQCPAMQHSQLCRRRLAYSEHNAELRTIVRPSPDSRGAGGTTGCFRTGVCFRTNSDLGRAWSLSSFTSTIERFRSSSERVSSSERIVIDGSGHRRPPLGNHWWSQAGSNRRPRHCERRALPAELWPRPRSAIVQRPETPPFTILANGKSRTAETGISGFIFPDFPCLAGTETIF